MVHTRGGLNRGKGFNDVDTEEVKLKRSWRYVQMIEWSERGFAIELPELRVCSRFRLLTSTAEAYTQEDACPETDI